MNVADLLVDGFGRVRENVHAAVEGLTAEQLRTRLDDEANSIAWLVWHLTRVQDDHVADVAGTEQVWTGQDWLSRFGLPFPAGDTGYGHRPADVEAVRVDDPVLLTGYYDAVHDQTVRYLENVDDTALDRVVDEAWDPPVTLGVRLVSVLDDDIQHAGQAMFVRGVLERR
ncbi:Protein of unknown function [Amycolatopsis pretoriensis]|uniref:DinB superfamily protein n=1 Tax=Amycolatopsis pretoriensis TaxID=218821 RepID=A0A1H5R3X4_9PSEU|nr:DUF664 domain-containing protein [Amycolatopsis pretoriensis]SEF32107.1 Protein of unknown function [Amycolatopsis pretoriensis]